MSDRKKTSGAVGGLMVVGLGIGCAVGVAMGNMSLGMAIGLALGLLAGAAIDKSRRAKQRDRSREL